MSYLTEDSLRLILFIAVVLIIDVLAFVLMYFLAKKYGTGLLFAPIPIYIAILTVILFLLFAPLFEAITHGIRPLRKSELLKQNLVFKLLYSDPTN